ncbi:MAG: nicotinamide-nucleotide amidohydrolase family protein [Lachnospiraceae bacterium]|nr:nicotinamide-nucleotide amidohydrolase family protein [Lachnospiraceae bacterium]
MARAIENPYSKILKLIGVSYGELAVELEEIFEGVEDVQYELREEEDGIHLEFITVTSDKNKAYVKLIPYIAKLKARRGLDIYAENEEDTLEASLVKVLADRRMTIATAESCTGGLVAATIINVSGASTVYEQGVITYTDEAKKELLGVSEETLKEHTAVSYETAKEMAEKVAEISGTRIGVSTTGVAGPLGGTKDDPPGTVYIGVSINGETTVKRCFFRGTRNTIRREAARYAIDMVRRMAQEY